MSAAATIVIASCKSDLRWTIPLATSMPVVVVEQCGGTKTEAQRRLQSWELMHTRRCGREAHSYLFFIYEMYAYLPERVVFLQGDAPRHLRRFSNATNIVASIKALAQSPLTFSMLSGTGTIATTPCQTNWKRTSLTQPGMLDVQLAVANTSVPVTTYTYAHFMVARRRIHRHARDYYKRLDDTFFGAATNGGACGRATASMFERAWPLMFGCSRPAAAHHHIVDHPSSGTFARACKPPTTLFCCHTTRRPGLTDLVPGEASDVGCA